MIQSKISSFWASRPGGSRENENGQVNFRKRKIDEEYFGQQKTAVKKMTLYVNTASPDMFANKTNENASSSIVEDQYLDEFAFEDFENNPFLSPKKDKSPKKGGILTENCSQSSDEENWRLELSDVSFESPVRCTILKFAVVTTGGFEQVLQVKDEKTGKKGICRLRDVWTCTPLSENDVVVIQTSPSKDGWVVDNKTGYLILHPNIILSSTSLVKGMFCLRRGVLSNFYGGVEVGSNGRMLIGRMVHELLQRCLRIPSCTEADLADMVTTFLQAGDYLKDLYFSDMNMHEIQKEVESFVPCIRHFLNVYINKKIKPGGKNFAGSIEEVLDIEELIKSPNLGFQGRIDATVKIKSLARENLAPMELKTGRASFSAEHRSQVILYVLLMNEIGRKVESGLLLYLKDGIMEEVLPTRDEVRNLFLLRNRLVGYYKSIRANDLPEPIRSSSCGRCPYERVCVTNLKTESFYETHPLRSVDIPDIKPSHVDYFMRWNQLLWLEYGHVMDEDVEDIDNLELKPNIEKLGNQYKHHFIAPVIKKPLLEGTFVTLFEGSNCVGKGNVIQCTSSECSVLLDHKLDSSSEKFRICIFKLKFLNMYLSNLGLLLEERFQNLRELIVDKRKPTFEEKLDKKTFKERCLKKLLNLNKEQQKAVLKSLVSNDYLLIKGPPGTGKTETIVALIRIFVALQKKVLLAGHTNSSVDNILLRLNDVEFLRLGSLKSSNSKIHSHCYTNLIKGCKNASDVEKLFNRSVIATTCLAMDDDFVGKMKFDVCIVDESSQVLQCEILRPLFTSKKFILVGDEDQLPPVINNKKAKKSGMGESMFERLRDAEATVELRLQYRMNSRINSLANSITYGGLITCAKDVVANGTITIKNIGVYEKSEEWMRYVLSPSLKRSVVFIDTCNYFGWKGIETPERARSSRLEASILKRILTRMVDCGLPPEEIGVIAPFSDQVTLLKESLQVGFLSDIELNTVDQYQGRDKDVILFSCGKENQVNAEASEFEILNDMKRMTVAVTRAKHKLILVGDKRTMAKYGPFQKLFESLEESEFLRLSEGEKGFLWKEEDFPGA
ncbi:hypothetical protein RUM43_004593 [Polyplax serrata]|uniref:DNA helicase n=1 Tax=Polyplax serrata TaxID=468196 RepID=A0AAN8XM57_POLSC